MCFLFHPVKSLGRVGRLFFFFNFFYNLILTTNIQHIKVAHNLEHRSGISRHVVQFIYSYAWVLEVLQCVVSISADQTNLDSVVSGRASELLEFHGQTFDKQIRLNSFPDLFFSRIAWFPSKSGKSIQKKFRVGRFGCQKLGRVGKPETHIFFFGPSQQTTCNGLVVISCCKRTRPDIGLLLQVVNRLLQLARFWLCTWCFLKATLVLYSPCKLTKNLRLPQVVTRLHASCLSRLFIHKRDASCLTTCSKSANIKLHQVLQTWWNLMANFHQADKRYNLHQSSLWCLGGCTTCVE